MGDSQPILHVIASDRQIIDKSINRMIDELIKLRDTGDIMALAVISVSHSGDDWIRISDLSVRSRMVAALWDALMALRWPK